MAKMSQMFVELCLIVLVGQLAHVQCRSDPNYNDFPYESHSTTDTFVAGPEFAPVSPDETFPEKFYKPDDSANSLKDFTPEFTGDPDLESPGFKFADSNTIPAPPSYTGSYEYDASSRKTLPDASKFDIDPYSYASNEHHTKEDYKYDASKGDSPFVDDASSFADTTAVGTGTPGSEFHTGGYDYSSAKGSTKPLDGDSALVNVEFTEAN